MNIPLILFGLGLSMLGGYSIIRPQELVDFGSGNRFENSELSEQGMLIQRGKGMLVVFLGMMTLFVGFMV